MKVNDFIIKTTNSANTTKPQKNKTKLACLNEHYASIPKHQVYINPSLPGQKSHGENFFKSKQSAQPTVMPAFVPPSNRKIPIHKYQIMPGNNSQLVSRVFQEGCPRRSLVWHEMNNKQQNHYHFRWAPTSKGVNFERLSHNFVQVANHLEGHAEMSRKHELFRNVRQHLDAIHKQQGLETNRPMLFQVMPL